jgi:hypothetical protein
VRNDRYSNVLREVDEDVRHDYKRFLPGEALPDEKGADHATVPEAAGPCH